VNPDIVSEKPFRVGYSPTRGRSLEAVTGAMREWGAEHRTAAEDPDASVA